MGVNSRLGHLLSMVWLPLAILLLAPPLFPSYHTSATFNDSDESWNLERNYRHAHSRDVIVTSSMTHDPLVRNIVWSGVRGCRQEAPVKRPGDSTDDLLPRSSTCPWNWVINYDPRRTPSTLLVAHCACPNCLSAGTQGHRCQPVHYFRPVVYFRGTARESRRLFRLAVGCTCERHATS